MKIWQKKIAFFFTELETHRGALFQHVQSPLHGCCRCCWLVGVKVGHKPGSVHHSAKGGGWLSIWDHRCRWPRAARSGGTGQMTSRRSLALLPAGVYRASTSRCCWCALTAPLHPYLCLGHLPHEAIGGVFLWHYPHDHSHWALSSKPGL